MFFHADTRLNKLKTSNQNQVNQTSKMISHLCPLGHSIQWVAPLLLYVPFSHSTGPRAGLGHFEPAGHSVQIVEFSVTEKEPFAQGRWKESFSDGQCEPIGHGWQ